MPFCHVTCKNLFLNSKDSIDVDAHCSLFFGKPVGIFGRFYSSIAFPRCNFWNKFKAGDTGPVFCYFQRALFFRSIVLWYNWYYGWRYELLKLRTSVSLDGKDRCIKIYFKRAV